jgi:hypothetical protein
MADSEVAICNLALLKIGAPGGLIGSLEDRSAEAAACKLLYPQARNDLLREHRWPFATRHAYLSQLGGDDWDADTTFALGDYVSYAPSADNVLNPPESLSSFVYLSLEANNTGNQPDTSSTKWRQVSRAAWAYVFAFPDDVIAVHGLYAGIRAPRDDQQVPYAIEAEPSPGPGTVLLTDAGLPWALVDESRTGAVELVYTAEITDPAQFPSDFTSVLAWRIAAELALTLRKDSSEAEKCTKMAAYLLGQAKAASRREVQPDRDPPPSWIAARGARRR